MCWTKHNRMIFFILLFFTWPDLKIETSSAGSEHPVWSNWVFQVQSLSVVHNNERDEDTCHRNIWANWDVIRLAVAVGGIHGEPPEPGSSLAVEASVGRRTEVLRVRWCTHMLPHLDFERNSESCKEMYPTSFIPVQRCQEQSCKNGVILSWALSAWW